MNNLQAGFARLDITPPLGVRMAGYFYERKAEGVLDPLYVKALALKEGDKTALIMVCDLVGLSSSRKLGWDEAIAKRAGISLEQFFLHCTHTHTGPICCTEIGCCGVVGSDPMYDEWLLRRMGDAAVMAMADCKPVTSIRSNESLCPGVTHVRRFKMKDGHYQTWADYCDPNIEGWASEADESLRLVRIARENADEVVLFNFQCHPDCVNGNEFSADFPGMLCTRVEQAKPGTKCIYLNGAQGQMVTNDWWHGTTSRLPYEKAVEAADKLVSHALSVFDTVEPVPYAKMAWAQKSVTCKTKRDSSRIPEAKRLLALHKEGRDAEIGPDWKATPLIAEASKLVVMEEAGLDEVSLVVSAVSFGGLAFAGIAGEPFCELGKEIRDRSPFPVTLFCSIVNGFGDYFPTAEAFDQDGYEPRNCRFTKGIGEHLVEASCDLLQSL